METQDPEDRIEILMPTDEVKPSRNDRRAERIYLMNEALQKMRKQTSNEVAEKLVSHLADFNLKMRNIIINNLRSPDLTDNQFFLYLIFFRPENIYELSQSSFCFETDIPIFRDGQPEKFFFHRILKSIGIEGYCHHLKKLKADLNQILEQKKTNEEFQGNMVVYFENLISISMQDLEHLVCILKEDIVEVYPQFKFSFLINIVEKYHVTFRIKNLHLQRIDFVSKQSLFYKLLMKMIKVSLLPGPVFSPRFLSRIERNFKDFCTSLCKETKKWITYKEIHLAMNFDRIYARTSIKKFKDAARILNYQFLVGLKLLKCVLKYYHELPSDYIHERMFTTIVEGIPLDFYKIQGEIERRYQNFLINFNKLGNKVRSLESNNSSFELVSFFEVAQKKFDEYKKKKDEGTLFGKSQYFGSKSRGDFMVQQIVSTNVTAGQYIRSSEGMEDIFNHLNKGLEKMVFKYFTVIKDEEPAFLIDDYVHMESFVNPDMSGTMYEAFNSREVHDTMLRSSKQFFDIFKSIGYLSRAIDIVDTFESKIEDDSLLSAYNKALKNSAERGKPPNLKSIDLFMYNQQLFEHLKLINLQYSNHYKIEKLFFAKYNLTQKEKIARARMNQLEEE